MCIVAPYNMIILLNEISFDAARYLHGYTGPWDGFGSYPEGVCFLCGLT